MAHKIRILEINFTLPGAVRLPRIAAVLGYEYFVAWDEITARLAIERDQPDLILVCGDLANNFLAQLRHIYAGPIIAINEVEAKESLKAGANFHIQDDISEIGRLLLDIKSWSESSQFEARALIGWLSERQSS